MEDDNELPADENLGRYDDTMNFHLDNIIDPPNDDGEMNLIKQYPYFGIDCFPNSRVHTRGQLNILSITAQSLNSKHDELLLLLNIAQSQNIRFHVICVQETWFGVVIDKHISWKYHTEMLSNKISKYMWCAIPTKELLAAVHP